jgi:hypothetical protein
VARPLIARWDNKSTSVCETYEPTRVARDHHDDPCRVQSPDGRRTTLRRNGCAVWPTRSHHDRDNRFFQEDSEELCASGYLKLAVPIELGGRGLSLCASLSHSAGSRITHRRQPWESHASVLERYGRGYALFRGQLTGVDPARSVLPDRQ